MTYKVTIVFRGSLERLVKESVISEEDANKYRDRFGGENVELAIYRRGKEEVIVLRPVTDKDSSIIYTTEENPRQYFILEEDENLIFTLNPNPASHSTRVWRMIEQFVEYKRPDVMIDVGTGYGGYQRPSSDEWKSEGEIGMLPLVKRASERNTLFVLVEPQTPVIEELKTWKEKHGENCNVEIIQAALPHLPFRDNCADVVTCIDVLKFIDTDEEFHASCIDELLRVCNSQALINFNDKLGIIDKQKRQLVLL